MHYAADSFRMPHSIQDLIVECIYNADDLLI